MTKIIMSALDAITAKVLAYRPKDKGEAAKKIGKRVKREAAKEAKREERE